jgi:iron complex outermembrane receptor protein
MKYHKFYVTVCFLFIAAVINAQDTLKYNLNEVIVTAGKSPISFSNAARSIEVLTLDEIKNAPVFNVQDLLQYSQSVDIKQRGAENVQADISIRGGTFEQTLIMIDGIKLTDPQTAHHNLSLPISFSNIERIEILRGQGSRVFGPNAFTGAVNVITRKDLSKRISLNLRGGENNLYETGLTASYPLGNWGNTISINKSKSDGYRENSHFDISNFNYNSYFNLGKGNISFMFGYLDKKFAANTFYSTRFNNQWEHTITRFINTSADFDINRFQVNAKVFYGINTDDYILDFNRPSFYRNFHKSFNYGNEISLSRKFDFGNIVAGGEFNKDEIYSTNLGNHQRAKYGFFTEYSHSIQSQFIFSLGFFAYKYGNIDWKFWPGIDLAYKLDSQNKLYATFGKSFRLPSYTELYYTDPVTIGNPNLMHEESTSYEVGFNRLTENYIFNLALFRRDGKNIIDWLRLTDQDKWQVANLTELNTTGIESSIETNFNNFFIRNLKLSYTYLDLQRNAVNLQSKYILDNLKHQAVIGVDHYSILGIVFSWKFRYENRVNLENIFLADLRISKSLNYFDFFVNASNLFNKAYSDFDQVPLPGRWISAGLKVNLEME